MPKAAISMGGLADWSLLLPLLVLCLVIGGSAAVVVGAVLPYLTEETPETQVKLCIGDLL